MTDEDNKNIRVEYLHFTQDELQDIVEHPYEPGLHIMDGLYKTLRAWWKKLKDKKNTTP